MNQSSLKPWAAPSLGVTMSSPEPTMIALRIRPGPSCRAIPAQVVGAGRGEDRATGTWFTTVTCGSERMDASCVPAALILEVDGEDADRLAGVPPDRLVLDLQHPARAHVGAHAAAHARGALHIRVGHGVLADVDAH